MSEDNRYRDQAAQQEFLLGAERFEKISAVEGIILSDEMRRRADEARRLGLSAEQRIERIKEVYRKG
ncbi:hypothetical protein I8G32_03656 [Rhodopseudomonas palustris]|uniref:Uncharacterized protein n=1 Tax=Rhodopseudomonas palustris (strain ATCC BAA-98 / CGA009) TaxID=258594 RepID=Q6N401_RHOPA|nr:hypothetical protein [Rhodopseudomonas palustris]ACF02555.1 hypothetical protein Rpal_4059 [Rhodopseudomonas palustris TIE-1]CAE28982.1 hypothetical protein RPA3541 [Rhodopseudomonas palustris CGA009]OPF97656.1 hypothetical protein B1S06_00340 [Rhodopseudomonas palustris]PPQ42812.1 hypothetical protein CKO39_14815 [Rhodopseudomonas palustris]QQM05088.1 hypothetical protein I8G32_03656 [Rhodopseudomonas palustris]